MGYHHFRSDHVSASNGNKGIETILTIVLYAFVLSLIGLAYLTQAQYIDPSNEQWVYVASANAVCCLVGLDVADSYGLPFRRYLALAGMAAMNLYLLYHFKESWVIYSDAFVSSVIGQIIYLIVLIIL